MALPRLLTGIDVMLAYNSPLRTCRRGSRAASGMAAAQFLHRGWESGSAALTSRRSSVFDGRVRSP